MRPHDNEPESHPSRALPGSRSQGAVKWGLAACRLSIAAAIMACGIACAGQTENVTNTAGLAVVYAEGPNLQKVIDAIPPNSTIVCDPNQQLVFSSPLRINKPLTLRKLCARLPQKLGQTPLVIVTAKGVTISDFELTGNGDTVPQSQRAPLLVIGAGDFRVENGRLNNSSKDGIMIDGDVVGGGDLVGGVVRDIVGHNIIRDLVSISGSGGKGHRIRNVLVDNVRCHGSALRGCVEVSDGTDNITVRKVYAEQCVYAVGVQDHGQPEQINRNVVIEDVYALRCKHAIRTSNRPLGHAYLTVRDITAKQCAAPIQISNTESVTLSNVRVIDHDGKGHPVHLSNCSGASVRDVTLENTAHKGPGMLLADCDATLVDGFGLRGSTENLTSAICYRIASDRTFSGLRIGNVWARGVKVAGILLENTSKKGTLTDYIISGNLCTIADHIRGQRSAVTNNLP